jgi:FKBP-type peptidyl-prolyl cis-trans isomerase (trigger factor)
MAGPPKKPTTPPVRGRPQTAPTGRGGAATGGNRDGRTVSLEAGRALQRALDDAPNARVAVKASAASTSTAEKALAAAATIELKIAALPIGKDLVDRRIEELRKLISMTMPRVRAPVETGDEVEADVLGYVDGKVFMAQQAVWLDVRPNPWLPGLIEGFVGLTPPESAVFQLKVPAHYPVPEMRGKVAAFAITLRQARQRIMPEADDPIFLQLTNRNVKTRAELETRLRDELAEERGRLCVDEAKVGLLRQLYIKIGVDDVVPDELIDEELRRRWKAALGDAMALQGVSMEDQKKSLVDFSTPAMRAEARRSVWEGRCLEAIAEAHGLEATETEVHKIITDLSPDIRRGDIETILYQHAALSKDIVKNLRLHRALLLLLGKAKVVFDATPPPENRVVLAPLPTTGSGGARAGSGAQKTPGEMTAARGLKRPPSRGP